MNSCHKICCINTSFYFSTQHFSLYFIRHLLSNASKKTQDFQNSVIFYSSAKMKLKGKKYLVFTISFSRYLRLKSTRLPNMIRSKTDRQVVKSDKQTHTYTHKFTHVNIYSEIDTSSPVEERTHIHTLILIYTLYVCVYVHVCACVCTYICPSLYTYTLTRIYIYS